MSGIDYSLENRLTNYEKLIDYAIGIGADAAHYCVSAEAWVPKLAKIAEKIEESKRPVCLPAFDEDHVSPYCSICEDPLRGSEFIPNFCANCGAMVLK